MPGFSVGMCSAWPALPVIVPSIIRLTVILRFFLDYFWYCLWPAFALTSRKLVQIAVPSFMYKSRLYCAIFTRYEHRNNRRFRCPTVLSVDHVSTWLRVGNRLRLYVSPPLLSTSPSLRSLGTISRNFVCSLRSRHTYSYSISLFLGYNLEERCLLCTI